MYCHCCQTRILRNEITANEGQCPECGTVPEWHSKLWDDEIPEDFDEQDEEFELLEAL